MDALLAGLIGSSLLSALVAFRTTAWPVRSEKVWLGLEGTSPEEKTEHGSANRRWIWALVSGCLAGLAMLTKGTAVLLVPTLLLLALVEAWRAPPGATAWKPAARQISVWAMAAIASLSIWPALLVDPVGTFVQTAEFVRDRGGHTGELQQGLLFVPIALALRLGPATVLGVVFLAVFGAPRRWWRPIGSIVAFVLMFGLAVAMSRKEADRYLLPVFPPLGVLAALGWWSASRRLAAVLRVPRAVPLSIALAGLLQIWPLLATSSDPLAAYNPLVGGADAAEASISVGWGEGLDEAGMFLARQPDAERLVVGIWDDMLANFEAHAPGRVVGIKFGARGSVRNPEALAQANYYIDYIRPRQQNLVPSQLLNRRPELVVSINGLEYVRVYRLKPR
jgi:4-amino-4-deoxy-L-arabinose transferase-like glycosyltransferase